LQVALWVAVVWMTTRFGGQSLSIPPGFELPTQLLVWAFVYFVLGYAMYGGLLAGVGALAPEVKDTKGASVLVMSPLIAVYVFVVLIVTRPDTLLALVISLFPLTAPVGMIARMTVTEVPWWQPVLAAALQMLTVIVIVRSVARLFRAQHMLSGQPFDVNRYLRALAGRA
jgi:ABC-2 type transport system permease protein